MREADGREQPSSCPQNGLGLGGQKGERKRSGPRGRPAGRKTVGPAGQAALPVRAAAVYDFARLVAGLTELSGFLDDFSRGFGTPGVSLRGTGSAGLRCTEQAGAADLRRAEAWRGRHGGQEAERTEFVVPLRGLRCSPQSGKVGTRQT